MEDTETLKGRLKAVMEKVLDIIRQGKKEVDPDCQGDIGDLYLDSLSPSRPTEYTASLENAQGNKVPSDVLKLLGQAMAALNRSTPPQPTNKRKEPPAPPRKALAVSRDDDDDDDEEEEEEGVEQKPHAAKREERHAWVRKGATKPNEKDLRHMGKALEGLYLHWGGKVGFIAVEVHEDHPPLVAFTHEGGTYMPLRHLMLYMSYTKKVFPDWRFNVDRIERRMIALMDSNRYPNLEGLRSTIGMIKITPSTEVAQMEGYMRPTDSKRNTQKTNIPVVEVECLKPRLKFRCNGAAVRFDDYIDLLLTHLVPVGTAVDTDNDEPPPEPTVGEILDGKKKRPKKKVKKHADHSDAEEVPENRMTFTQEELKVTDDNLRSMIEYCEVPLRDGGALWLLDAVEKQDAVDSLLLNRLEQEGDKTMTTFRGGLQPVHRKCGQNKECDYKITGKPCLHDRCERKTCRRCPVILKNYYYLCDLADTYDFVADKPKTTGKAQEDMWKVHHKKDGTMVKTVHANLAHLRDFSVWYLINLHELMGPMYLQDRQPTIPTLLMSKSLRRLLQKWYLSCSDLQRDTKHKKMRVIRDLMNGHVRNFIEDHIGDEHDSVKQELIQRVDNNVDQLDRYMPQVAGAKQQLQMNTKTTPSTTDVGKAPPMERVVAAYDHFRSEVWSKLAKARGREDAHEFPQRVLMLALLKMGMGPRPSMLSHMAIGTNLKTVKWLAEDKTIDHQEQRKRGGRGSRDVNVDKEDMKERFRYAKVFAMKYRLDVSKYNLLGNRSFEVDYYVNLLALCRELYGHKNSGISARILPFYREMSLEFIDYAASLLWLRSRVKTSTELAKQYLSYRQTTEYAIADAYDWLHSKEVDFVKMAYDELGPVRVFYRSATDLDDEMKEPEMVHDLGDVPERRSLQRREDASDVPERRSLQRREDASDVPERRSLQRREDLYGTHTEHSKRGSSITDVWEAAHLRYVTEVFRKAMRDFYREVRPEDVHLEELTDGTLDIEKMPKQAMKYTLRGVRSATADYIKRSFPDMPEDIKDLIVNQTFMHKLETHDTVYVRDSGYVRCVSLRSWVERGMPWEEWQRVKHETKAQRIPQAARLPPRRRPLPAEFEFDEDDEEESSAAGKGKERKRKRHVSPAENDDEEERAAQPPATKKRVKRGGSVPSMGIGQGFLVPGSEIMVCGEKVRIVRTVRDGSAEYRKVIESKSSGDSLSNKAYYLQASDFSSQCKLVTNLDGSQTWEQLFNSLS